MITITNLNVEYGKKEILKDFTLAIEEHSTICIMGDSGSGKSTLLKVLLGLVTPVSGEVNGIQGKAFSMVFQEDRLCMQLSAIKNVMMVLDGAHKREQAHQHLLCLLDEDDLHVPATNLSGGMKRRVSIARAFAHSSDIILMDEPFTGLDEGNKQRTIDYIKKYQNGRTIILVTHDIQEAKLMGANQIIQINLDQT